MDRLTTIRQIHKNLKKHRKAIKIADLRDIHSETQDFSADRNYLRAQKLARAEEEDRADFMSNALTASLELV